MCKISITKKYIIYIIIMIKLKEQIVSYDSPIKDVNQRLLKLASKFKKGGQIKEKKPKIHIKKKNEGKFTQSAKDAGESVQEHARKVLADPNATPLQKKRANFARNSKLWKHSGGGKAQEEAPSNQYVIEATDPQVLQRYISLINNGIDPQAAFDSAHLSIIEDGRPNKYYSFGKRASTLQGWTKNATDSLTIGRYKGLQGVQNFGQFKSKLRKLNYNTRPAFYNAEIGRGRNKDKGIVNKWNQAHGLPLIASLMVEPNENMA